MSQRGKRGNHLHHPRIDVEPQPPPTKRRKGRPPNGGGGGISGGLGGGGGSTAGSGGCASRVGSVAVSLGNNAINFGNSSDVGGLRVSATSINLSNNHSNHNNNNNNNDMGSQTPRTGTCSGGGGGVVDDVMNSNTAKMTGSTSSAIPWQARSAADIKMSSIYNRSSTEAPAELYRKDLISAMKLPDSEQLANYEYLVVTDQWKQEWERGVQVPVNPDSLPEPYVEVLSEPIVPPAHDFKLPKNRFLRISKDGTYSAELHCLTNVVALAENICAYDIDQVDEAWLKLYNADRFQYGAFPISETQFERVIEELEIRCWEQIQVILKNEEGLGIEYDENVICDVCRSPDSEEANEMVFCDNCNICVHQACYGITAIPSGQWLCRTCSIGIKPKCVLCPNKGGAMKSTKSGKNWAHVSCALWIPEVSIGCVDRMEPITKISSIPPSRWGLHCVLCRERVGACIQCSVKTCKTAYHVTCAFQHGLEMRAIIEEGNAEDGVKLRSYCHKHSVSKGKKDTNHHNSSTNCKNKNSKGNGSGGEDDDVRKRKNRKSDLTSEERNQVRAQRLKEVEAEFDKHVNIKDISCHLFDVDEEAVEAIHNYWKLKRRSQHNRALIPPKSEDVEMIARKQEQQDIENHKLVVHLRQDLERVRNLCYMVSRREKLSRSLFKLREQVFYKQISVLNDPSIQNGTGDGTNACDEQFKNAVIYANDGPTLYDKFYSSVDKGTPAQYKSLDYIIEKIVGHHKSTPVKSIMKKNATRRTSISPSKRSSKHGANASAAVTTTISSSQSKNTNINAINATKKVFPNKKVNNGALSTLKHVQTASISTPGISGSLTTTASSIITTNNGDIVAKNRVFKEYQCQYQVKTKQCGRRNSYTMQPKNVNEIIITVPTNNNNKQQQVAQSGEHQEKALLENTATEDASLSNKSHLNISKRISSGESSSSNTSGSGSSSEDDDDSSTENGSSSGTGTTSDGGIDSRTSSTATDSTSSYCDTQSRVVRKSTRSKATQKKQSYSRSIDMRVKRKRKDESIVSATPVVPTSVANNACGTGEQPVWTPEKRESKRIVEVTATILSSASETEEVIMDGNNTKKMSARVPAKSKSKSNLNDEYHKVNITQTLKQMPLKNPISEPTVENCLRSREKAIEINSKKQPDSKEVRQGDYIQMDCSRLRSTRLASDVMSTYKENCKDSKAKRIGDIYTDSSTESLDTEDNDKDDRTAESNVSDSQNQQTIRTKAALKEFTLQQQVCSRSTSKEHYTHTNRKITKSNAQIKETDVFSSMEAASGNTLNLPAKMGDSTRSQKFITDLLVVPQRQAAKKAFENMRSTNVNAPSVAVTATAITTSIISTTPGATSNNYINNVLIDNDVKLLVKTTTTSSQTMGTTISITATTMARVMTAITTTATTTTTATKHKEEKLEKMRNSKDRNLGHSSVLRNNELPSEKPTHTNKRGRPPKNLIKDSAEANHQQVHQHTSLSALSSNAVSAMHRKDSIAVNMVEKSLRERGFSTGEQMSAKSVQNNEHSQSSNSATNSQKNLLVAYVPQRQAAKKAAEQLRNSNKCITPAESLLNDDKDRCNANEKENKIKTPENRTKMTTRRMSVRDTASVICNNRDTTSGDHLMEKPITTTNRRRSKDEVAVPNSLPSKRAQSDKKILKLSITSSSESDSSSSSSTSNGSASSSNSSSSYSTSEDEDLSEPDEKINTGKTSESISLKCQVEQSQNFNDQSQKCIDEYTGILTLPIANVTVSGASHNLKSPHQQQRPLTSVLSSDNNASTQSKTVTVLQEKYIESISSLRASEKEEHKNEFVRKSMVSSETILESKGTQDLPQSSERIQIRDKDIEITRYHNRTNKMPNNIEQPLNKCTVENVHTSPVLSTHNLENKSNKHSKCSAPLQNVDAEKISNGKDFTNQEKIKNLNMNENLDRLNKFRSVGNNNNVIHNDTNECSEVPMDIDEELTTTKTVTINEGPASTKLDELLVDLDDRPPAAPIPASPIPSSLCSNDEDSEEHANNSGGNYQHRECEMRTRKRRRRRRRTHTATGGSHIISGEDEDEEEHTPHTQHILNEMELVRALEEERKNELAALNAESSKYSASSSSPAVAVIAPEPPEIIELDSNSNSSHKTSPPAFGSTDSILSKTTPANITETLEVEKQQSHMQTSITTTLVGTMISSLHQDTIHCTPAESQQPQYQTLNVHQTDVSLESVNKGTMPQSLPAPCTMEPTHHPIVDTILDLEDNVHLQQKQKQQERDARLLTNSILHSSPYQTNTDKSVLDPVLTSATDHPNLLGSLNDSNNSISKLNDVAQEDSCQATRNLLEKLRKTKRNRTDCETKEPDLMLPPLTPAIPSVYPFHNAADPDDIIDVQKEQCTEENQSHNNNNNNIDCLQQHPLKDLQSNSNDLNNINISALPYKPMAKGSQSNMYLSTSTSPTMPPTSISNNNNLCSTDNNNMTILHNSLNYPVNNETNCVGQKSLTNNQEMHQKLKPLTTSQNISQHTTPHSCQAQTTTNITSTNFDAIDHMISHSTSVAQQSSSNVVHISSTLLQKDFPSGHTNESNNKDCNAIGNNERGIKEITPDFVDLHAAAAAAAAVVTATKKNVDFTAAIRENVDSIRRKLIVDCDYDENTRMQSPYNAMPVSRIWNERDLIAERRSTSPSSVSESNDQTTSLELQISRAQSQQQPQVQQANNSNHQVSPLMLTNQIPTQETHMHLQPQQQQHVVAQNIINNNNNNSNNNNDINSLHSSLTSPNCKNDFFNSISTFDINAAPPFQQHVHHQHQSQQQHQPQHQHQHTLNSQRKSHSSTASSYAPASMVNGIDGILNFDHRFNSPQATPTTTQSIQQQQQQTQMGVSPSPNQQQYTNSTSNSQQAQYNVSTTPTNQQQHSYNETATHNLFNMANSPLTNQQQVPSFGSNNTVTTTNDVMYAGSASINNTAIPSSVATAPSIIPQHQHTSQTAQDIYGSRMPVPPESTTNSVGHYAAAAFTSSNHNMAMTAAIVSGGTQHIAASLLTDPNSPHQHHTQAPPNQYNVPASSAVAGTVAPYNNLHVSPCGDSTLKSQQQLQPTHTVISPKETALKIRSSVTYNNQQQQQQQPQSHQNPRLSHKSPQAPLNHKSPGKSPRQMDIISKQLQQQQQQHTSVSTTLPDYVNCTASKPTKFDPLTHTLAGKPRQRAPRQAGINSRGRGRGRGRGRSSGVNNSIIPLPLPMAEYVNVNNLVGTPFEFNYDEDMSSTGLENLQSLRDRRRSFDCRNAHGNSVAHDAQKYPCGSTACKTRGSSGPSNNSTSCVGTATVPSVSQPITTNSNESIKNIRVPGPISSLSANSNQQQQHHQHQQQQQHSILHAIVQPMLPGPVDMRTYNLAFEPQHSSASQEAYNKNLLGAFDSGTADQALSEFDEEDERAFQSALRATGTNSYVSKQQQPLNSAQIYSSSTLVGTTQANTLPCFRNAIGKTELAQSTSTANIGADHNSIVTANVPLISSLVATTSTAMELIIPPDIQTSMETTSEDVSIDSDTILTTKASLSDARNQLKLKIKGPLAYPDHYSTSNAITISISSHTVSVAQSSATNVQTIASVNAVAMNASACGGSGNMSSSTNSRRMRKKELLSLYATADDSSCGLPPTDSTLLCNVMDITRKTDSVSSEMGDYSTEVQTSNSGKRLKKNSSRELRSSDVSIVDHGDGNPVLTTPVLSETRRRSACSSVSTDNNSKIGAASSAGKRRGRSKTVEGFEDEPTPKLKIKIRNLGDGCASATTISHITSDHQHHTEINHRTTYEVTRRSMACPPKKRLTSNYTPTLEDLMRDSMNYRDQVMQEFGGDDEERIKRNKTADNNRGIDVNRILSDISLSGKKIKTSKPKKDKKEKKRHKNKNIDSGSILSATTDNMTTTIIEQPSGESMGNAPKLILRIGKRKKDSSIHPPSSENVSHSPALTNIPPPLITTPPSTVSVEEHIAAPIRLKLARVSDGGGYVIGDKKCKKITEKLNDSCQSNKKDLSIALHQSNTGNTNYTETSNFEPNRVFSHGKINACSGGITPTSMITTTIISSSSSLSTIATVPISTTSVTSSTTTATTTTTTTTTTLINSVYKCIKNNASEQSPVIASKNIAIVEDNNIYVQEGSKVDSDAAKEPSTTLPCLIVDTSKNNDFSGSNTVSTVNDITPNESTDKLIRTTTAAVIINTINYENSNSVLSGGSSLSSLGTISSTILTNGNRSNNNNNNNNTNHSTNMNSNSNNNNNNNLNNNNDLLTLQKDCEVR